MLWSASPPWVFCFLLQLHKACQPKCILSSVHDNSWGQSKTFNLSGLQNYKGSPGRLCSCRNAFPWLLLANSNSRFFLRCSRTHVLWHWPSWSTWNLHRWLRCLQRLRRPRSSSNTTCYWQTSTSRTRCWCGIECRRNCHLRGSSLHVRLRSHLHDQREQDGQAQWKNKQFWNQFWCCHPRSQHIDSIWGLTS